MGWAVFMAIPICGTFGLYSLFDVVKRIVKPQPTATASWFVRCGIVVGLVAIIPYLDTVIHWPSLHPVMILACLPIAVSVHVLYLGRDYIFGRSKPATHKNLDGTRRQGQTTYQSPAAAGAGDLIANDAGQQ